MNGPLSTVSSDRRSALACTQRTRKTQAPLPVQRRILHPGETLIHAGKNGPHAYVVGTGCFKSYRVNELGEEQIMGLHGPGDVVGFDAVLGRPASYSVVAVDTGSVQVVHNAMSLFARASDPDLAELIFESLHREMHRLADRLQIERHPSERRVAEFLLDYARRQKEHGRSDERLNLPISRRSVACYLGLTPETVSRVLSALQERKLIRVCNRQLTILDRGALAELAAGRC